MSLKGRRKGSKLLPCSMANAVIVVDRMLKIIMLLPIHSTRICKLQWQALNMNTTLAAASCGYTAAL
jgi:hypothetical protein